MILKHIMALSSLALLYSLQNVANPGEQKVSVPRLNLHQTLATAAATTTVAIEMHITEPTPREEQKRIENNATDRDNGKVTKALSNEQILNSLKAQKSFLQALDPAAAQNRESNKIEATITALETKK